MPSMRSWPVAKSLTSMASLIIPGTLAVGCTPGNQNPPAVVQPITGNTADECGQQTQLPAQAVLSAGEVWTDLGGGVETSGTSLSFTSDGCTTIPNVALQTAACDAFPWLADGIAAHSQFFSLGGRRWVSVTFRRQADGSTVREQVLVFGPGSTFADKYRAAARQCNAETVAQTNGTPTDLVLRDASWTQAIVISQSHIVSVEARGGDLDATRLNDLANKASTKAGKLR